MPIGNGLAAQSHCCSLQVEEMESALLATFCGSPDWVHSQFPSHVKLALVQPAGGAEKGSTTTLAPNFKLFVPFKLVRSRIVGLRACPVRVPRAK